MHDLPPSWYAETPLPRQAARYLWWGLAVKTRATYHSTRKSYVSSCRIAGAGPFPASLFNLARWIAELGIRYLKAKTIKSYLAAVRLFLVDIGATQDELKMFSHPTLFRTIADIRRMNGEANIRERRSITRQVLLRILPLFDTTSLWGATMHASFCLAFAAFLRVGEFTWSRAERDASFQQWQITRGSVLLHPDHLQLSLPSSKTDTFRAGVTLTVAASFDEACAVVSIRNLFTRFPRPQSSPLFDLGPVTPFTRQLVTETLRSCLRNLGYRGNYSGHPFRRGAATSAREAGLTDEEIELLGRWKSDSYRLYIETSTAHILTATPALVAPLHGGTLRRRRRPVFRLFFLGVWELLALRCYSLLGPPLGPSPAQRLE